MDAWAGIEQATQDEQRLVNALLDGKLVDFGTRRESIRADVLRNLLLALQDDSATGQRVRLTGIRIQNAYLHGLLDLADLARPGVGLPALMLEHCDLPHGIKLEGSHFARLSIKGSRFRYLNMRESEIDGPFDFSGATPYDDGDGKSPEAWIDAQGCIVNGEITGSGARLARTPRPVADVKKGERRYALSLANADVRGSVMLLNGFSAQGGMCLRSARIRGDVWASGAIVTKGEGYALNAQAARIGDVVHLNHGFTARGTVWLQATQIGARLLLDGATLYGTDDNGSEAPHRARIALEASNLQVAAGVCGEKFTAYGEVNFSGASIRGTFRCGRATFSNWTSDGRARALVATNAELGDEVQFDGANVKGRINLNGVKVGGRLSFNGAAINNKTADGSGVALSAIGARIGGNLRFAGLGAGALANGGCENVFRSHGHTNFNGAEVGGDLLFRGCSLRNGTGDGKGIALSAKGIRVGGNVEFTDDFSAEGATVLGGAIVGRGIRFKGAEFRNQPRSAIYAKDMQIGDDLRFEDTTAKGDLRLERIDITGSLVWNGLKISCQRKGDFRSPLDLRHGRIGSVLKAQKLIFDPPSSIDLGGMRAGAIEHTWSRGWGLLQPELTVNLDGLTYERIVLHSTDRSASASPSARPEHLLSRIFGRWRNPLADKYKHWLGLQGKQTADEENDFFPQPYRQLARVLRNQGEENAARDVAIAEQWRAPKPGLLPKIARWVFGWGFGFGLRPRNAMVTLVAFLLVGAVGVHMAKTRGMLMESLVVASTGAEIPPPGEKEAAVLLKRAVPRLDGSGPATEVSCTDAANTLTDDLVYAADMLVPFIPLHQEGKCEIVPRPDVPSGVWRVLKAVYEVTGWVIFSLALVTFSGVLKRFDRDAA